MPSSNTTKKTQQHGTIGEFNIVDLNKEKKSPGASYASHNIVTIDVPTEQAIDEYSPGFIKDSRGIRYSEILRGAGTNLDQRKNERFRISDLTRGPLSVEAEEEDRIEREVIRRLTVKMEEVRSNVERDAFAKGYEEGKTAGREQVIAQAKPSLERVDSMLASFEGMRHDVFKANEEFLMRMVYRIAKAIVLREVKEDKDYTKRLASEILEKVGARENIKIYVGQEVYSAAEQLKTDLAQSLGQLKNISIELDAEIKDRGCRIETDFGEVDANIEMQIENAAKALGVG